jgi:hypothetical protein
MFDFTLATIPNADGPAVPLDNRPASAQACGVTAFFGNLESHLCNAIRSADFVVGCAAWLTNHRILNALSAPKWGCQVVVQKEDWLRPDIGSDRQGQWKGVLRERYDELHCDIDRHEFSRSLEMPFLSENWCVDEHGIRCAGNHNSARSPAFPRMHHKFFVMCDVEVDAEFHMPTKIVGRSVWTGSFNPTANGTKSRENAVLIASDEIAQAFLREWFQVYAISEPLDWESEWCQPEYRIGT